MTAKETSFWDFKGAEDYVDNLMFMGSPFPMLFVLVSYLFFVLKCGPKLMENRPAYQLKYTLLLYNTIQAGVALYCFIGGISGLSKYGFFENGFCALDDTDVKIKLLNGHHLHVFHKMSELLDTIFFVLRKKWNQVSFLHVYHHSFMFFTTWVILKYEPTYSLLFNGVINCFVHVVMYTYYALSTFPGLQPYLWWKKYITKLQLVQFVLMLCYACLNFKLSTCPTSYLLFGVIFSQVSLFIYLFLDFYFKSYSEEKKGDGVSKEKCNGISKSLLEENVTQGLNKVKSKGE